MNINTEKSVDLERRQGMTANIPNPPPILAGQEIQVTVR
jgi:hypothetical protein